LLLLLLLFNKLWLADEPMLESTTPEEPIDEEEPTEEEVTPAESTEEEPTPEASVEEEPTLESAGCLPWAILFLLIIEPIFSLALLRGVVGVSA
jgi:hypothetical protein